ncbi:MAG: peptidylprolyl isomerase [Proteobacteria bacterium]|nr:peptidylprolyl isomerase [Pseudomonadota bacterium]
MLKISRAAAVTALLLIVPAAAFADDPVVAIINGAKLMKSDIDQAREGLPEQYQSVPFEQIYPLLLDSMIDSKLVAADARAKKLQNDLEFKRRLARVEEQILERYAVRKMIDAALTDDVLRNRYKDKAKAGGGEEMHARHILVKTEDEAKAVIKLLDGGADFVELAKKKSTGPSGPSGGDLGFFGKGQMVPEFEKAALTLAPGKYSAAPVKTQFGYHVIKLEERRETKAPSFEETVDQLRTEAAQEIGSAYIENLRAAAKIERFSLDGSKKTN